MTPKEKAQELINKMADQIEAPEWEEMAKQCALIAVEEIISSHLYKNVGYNAPATIKYWQEVKQEITKL